jgi:hypothetical protein
MPGRCSGQGNPFTGGGECTPHGPNGMRSTWRWNVQLEVGALPRANGEAKVNGSREPEVTATWMRPDKRSLSLLPRAFFHREAAPALAFTMGWHSQCHWLARTVLGERSCAETRRRAEISGGIAHQRDRQITKKPRNGGAFFGDERTTKFISQKVAEREGFEPSVGSLPRSFSKGVLSTTQPPLRVLLGEGFEPHGDGFVNLLARKS